MITVSRSDAIRFRFTRHELHRPAGAVDGPGDVALLDYGVQDTGPDGSAWALALRGLAGGGDPSALALSWTLRGAPHAYRRAELSAVAVASAPLSEADAAKRVFDAARPLRAAGIEVLDALRQVAEHLYELAAKPIAKGEASSRLTERLGEPYLRWCRPCGATHIYEQPFRLAALQAGLELERGTSPPVLRRVPRLRPAFFGRSGSAADGRFDVVRNHLRFYGPARPKDVAAFLDAPVSEVKRHWPDDVVDVAVSGEAGRSSNRWSLAADVDALTGAGSAPNGAVRLLGPYDPYLQVRDRELLVPDADRRKDLWRVLGRPGAVVRDGEVDGTWRPRAAGRTLTVEVEHWTRPSKAAVTAVEEQAERLAAHRGVTLTAVQHR
jgi:hypothetical protein